MARIIKNYIDKNYQLGVCYKKFVDDDYNDIDIGMLFYIAKQSDNLLFYGSGDKRFDYTFKQMYEEMVKKYSNLKFNKKYIADENYRDKTDSKYNNMVNYFNKFYSEERKIKKEQDFKKKVKFRKIKERYDEMEKKDYVLKKRRIIKDDDVLFLWCYDDKK